MKENKSNSPWHNALSLPSHLYQVEYHESQPFPVPSHQQTTLSEELYPKSSPSSIPPSSDDWWLAVQNGQISTLLHFMSHSVGFEWRSTMVQVSLSSTVNSGTMKEVKMGPLHAAVHYNQSSIVKLFLDSGLVSYEFLVISFHTSRQESTLRSETL
jgi:hypothetical protein